MFIMVRHAVIKEEILPAVKEAYEADIMGPVVSAKGNRIFFVLNNADREREVRQITGWDSKADCDRYFKGVLPGILEKWEGAFERETQTSFWALEWPGRIQLDPQALEASPIYVRMSRFKFKPEGMPAVRAAYEDDVMGPAADSPGNRFFFVLLSADEERVGSQVSGWASKEHCERWLREVWPKGYHEMQWVFEEQPTATFWELKWPLRIQF